MNNKDIHLDLLRKLEANPEYTQRELSKEMGVSLGKVNYCMKKLTEKGWVKLSNFNNNPNTHLAERLLLALKAGLEEGGEEGPIHSAGIKVADNTLWPLVDLRIDWLENKPIEELYKLWKAFEPQMKDYKSRALNPSESPSYGVPGDL